MNKIWMKCKKYMNEIRIKCQKNERDKDIKGKCGVEQEQQAEIYVWRIADKQDKHDRYWERLTIAWKQTNK